MPIQMLTKRFDQIRMRFRNSIRVQRMIARTTVKSRLLSSLLLLSVVPIVLLGISSFLVSYRDIEQKSVDFSTLIATKIASSIESSLNNHVDKLKRISSNSVILHEVYNLQSSNIEAYSPITVKQTLASIIGPGIGMDSVEIATKTGARIYYSQPITKGLLPDSQLIKDTEYGDEIVWKIAKKEIESEAGTFIILSRRMYLDPKDNISAGYCFMSLNMNYLNELCQQDGIDKSQQTIITEPDGTIIASTDQAKIFTLIDADIQNQMDARDAQDTSAASVPNHVNKNTFTVNILGERLLVSYQTLDLNHWRVITITPYSYLMQSTYRNALMFFSAVFIISILALVVALIIRDSITQPINRLNNLIVEVAKGNFKNTGSFPSDEFGSRDELIILEKGFHIMVERVKSLIDDVYKSKIKEQKLEFLKTESELNALQQQINPHFLYNILDAIYWTAQGKGDEEVSEMVTALGKFFRSSINKGLEYVTVAEEIDNVQNYVYLQRIRFSERFSVQWDIDDQMLGKRMIKLLLQPIIENAIIHGIEALESGGLITIKGLVTEGRMIFQISDNGKGMSEEEVNILIAYINSPSKDISGSIGVKNVHQRIQLYFGSSYGVAFKSVLGEGTTVTLSMPVLE